QGRQAANPPRCRLGPEKLKVVNSHKRRSIKEPEMSRALRVGLSVFVTAFALSAISSFAWAQAISQPEARHDSSPPLSSIPERAELVANGIKIRKEHRVKPLPRPAAPARAAAEKPQPDKARQKKAATKFQPTLLPSIVGIGKFAGYDVTSDPPD